MSDNLPTPTDKDAGRKAAPGGAKRWNREHSAYRCTDETVVRVLDAMPGRSGQSSSRVSYGGAGAGQTRALVSGTRLSRNLSQIASGAKDAKTLTFPRTVRETRGYLFWGGPLRSVVLNEGLQTLGDDAGAVFKDTRLRTVRLPSTLRVLDQETFADCGRLRRVAFAGEEGPGRAGSDGQVRLLS